MKKHIQHALCLLMAVLLLLSGAALPQTTYASDMAAGTDETIDAAPADGTKSASFADEAGRDALPGETPPAETPPAETLPGETPPEETASGGRGDLDLSDSQQVFSWIGENLPATLAGLEALPPEWWDSLLPNERLTAEGELLYRRFFGAPDGEACVPSPEAPDGRSAAEPSGAGSPGAEDAIRLPLAGESAYLQTSWQSVGNGRVNRKYLNGLIAFCFNQDKHFADGASYGFRTASEARIDGRLAYIVQAYGDSGADNAEWWSQNQVSLWAIQAGAGSQASAEAFTRSYCRDRGITDPGTVSEYVQNAGALVEGSQGRSGTAYLYQAGNPADQDLVTFTPVWEDPAEPEYDEVSASADRSAARSHTVSVNNKYAAVTGESLAGAVFEVTENGKAVGTIVTGPDGRGSCSWTVESAASASASKTYCRNYDSLPAAVQAAVTAYKSRDEAYMAALAEAEALAQAQADESVQAAFVVKLRETAAPDGFLLSSPSEQTLTLTGNDSREVRIANIPWQARLQLDKVDRFSGSRLTLDAEFILCEWDGAGYVPSSHYRTIRLPDGAYTVQADYAGAAQGILYYTQANQGRFCLREAKAPAGYLRDPSSVYFRMTKDGQIWDVSNRDPLAPSFPEDDGRPVFQNERQHGSVTLYKYDNEAEADYEDGSRITQGGVPSLDGAVYGLYAAEDIYRADRTDLLLYQKGQLVASATVGQSTVADSQGYLLDENGRRCLLSGKEPQKIATPGRTNFQQVELGSYYVSEITPPEGYLPDTATHRGEERSRYPVTFLPGPDSQLVLTREERAGEDPNLLTLDQDLYTHDLYSGDFVQKQAARFIKLDDAAGDTEKLPLYAGFSIYRIDTLSAVREGAIVPDGSVWSKSDMTKFSHYDFSAEATAVLYKRDSEAWTQADESWLEPTGVREREYRVTEMFSDEDGYFCTPELPYGQYILVETTVPEGKKQADPLLISITKDSALPQPLRYIGNETLETYVRIKKTDRDSLEPGFHTVLKPGVQYRLRLLSPVSDFDSRDWHVDDDGFLWYYNPTLDVMYGKEDAPFAVKCLYEDGRIVDAYIEFDQRLPFGEYELTEVTAPEGFVLSGYEQILADSPARERRAFRFVDAGASKTTFTIGRDTHSSELPHSRTDANPADAARSAKVSVDEYGRQIITVEQENKEQRGILTITKYGEQLYQTEAGGQRLCERAGILGAPPPALAGVWNTADQVFDYRLAPVAGAVFHIYAAEDIYTQQLDRSSLDLYADDLSHYLIWNKDDLVGAVATDETGSGYLADLPIGKYYIEETTAGEGFVLNGRREAFEITASNSRENFILYDASYINERQKVKLSVSKQDAGSEKPLAGAVFGLYAAEDIIGNLSYDAAAGRCTAGRNGRRLLAADTLVATAVSGDDGRAAFSTDLPLGKYYVTELAPPPGYSLSQPAKRIDIDASYAGQDTDVLVFDTAVFQNQAIRHLFTKSDLVSGALLSGAVLEIREIALDENGQLLRDENGNYVSSSIERWISDKDEVHYFYEQDGILTEINSEAELPEGQTLIVRHGHLVETLQAGRSYLFCEITAPWGYVGYDWSEEETRQKNRQENLVTEAIRFTAEDNALITEHDMKNQRTEGRISVTKEGEYIAAAEKTFLDRAADFFKTLFSSLFGRVENVRFEVRVRSDIHTPDQTDTIAVYHNGSESVPLVKDALVAVITTDINGIAVLDGLPLGSYYITETGVGEEDFLRNPAVTDITLEYPGQEVPVAINDGTRYQNNRQRVSLTVSKKARPEDAAFLQGGEPLPDGQTEILLPGAVFGLYTAEDLAGFAIDEATKAVTPAKDALLAADTLIEKAVTGEDGSLSFLSDLPCGSYYVKELQAPKGYLLSEETYAFSAAFTGPEGASVIEFSHDFYDKPLIVPFRKQDIVSLCDLPGATFAVTDENGVLVDQWVSDGAVHYIRHLQPDTPYTLTEIRPAPGYATAEAIAFWVEQIRDENGRLLQEIRIHTDEANLADGVIAMKDDVTKLSVSKVDSATGAMLLMDSQGTVVEEWDSESEPHYLEKIPVGEYILAEQSAPEGYQTAASIPFTVRDTAELQSVVMQDEKTPSHTPDQPQPHSENRPGEGGGDTGDSLQILLGLSMVIAGAAAMMRIRKKNEGGTPHA